MVSLRPSIFLVVSPLVRLIVHSLQDLGSLCFAMIVKVVDRLKAFFEMVSLWPSIFLIVSPIVRLMQDQVGRFCAMEYVLLL